VDHVDPKTDAQQKNSGEEVLSSPIPLIPPAPAATKKSCNCCHERRPRWKTIVEIGTLVGTIGAFIAASIYACIAARQLALQTKTERIANGPHITTNYLAAYHEVQSGRIFSILSVKSLGPTPARQMKIGIKMDFRPSPLTARDCVFKDSEFKNTRPLTTAQPINLGGKPLYSQDAVLESNPSPESTAYVGEKLDIWILRMSWTLSLSASPLRPRMY
jgi:hypothetical protein